MHWLLDFLLPSAKLTQRIKDAKWSPKLWLGWTILLVTSLTLNQRLSVQTFLCKRFWNVKHYTPACKLFNEYTMLYALLQIITYQGVGINACIFAFLPPSGYICCMHVCLGGAIEATLVSVLETNLACAQNGSLYQCSGSLESGGSSSSDAFLLTAHKDQPDNHLPEAHCVLSKDKEGLFVSLLLI